MKLTIDWGIDLGTSNSAGAILVDNDLAVIKNELREEITPSVVSVRSNAGADVVQVGKPAKQRLQMKDGSRAVAMEFKPHMGQPGWSFAFPGVGTPLSAPALSAHVLRKLRQCAPSIPGAGPMRSAVICVPAAFTNPQYDDTKLAGQIAGFEYVELLAEPIAAALAYAHRAGTEGSRLWLAFDLGGGTFDAALVRGEDGVFAVHDHRGDRNLGGKNLDDEIIQKLIVPTLPAAIQERVKQRSSTEWWALKAEVEAAKCAVSFAPEAPIFTTLGDHTVEYFLRQDDVNELQARLFRRAIDMCRALIQEKGYGAKDVEKVLLIGGPTLSPFLQQMVSTGATTASGFHVEGLGIPIDTAVNPMTAVAQGAALYAAGRQWEAPAVTVAVPSAPSAQGVIVSLKPPAQVSEPEIRISGTLRATDPTTPISTDWRVTVQRLDSTDAVLRETEPVAVSEKGSFTTRLALDPGKNRFRLVVLGGDAETIAVEDGEFTITRGVSSAGKTANQGLGVADQNGKTRFFYQPGDPLGHARRDVFKTTVSLRPGGTDSVVIPIVQGIHEMAHLNRVVYMLRISPEDVGVAIPSGSEVEVELLWREQDYTIVPRARFLDFDVDIEARIDSDQQHRPIADLRAALSSLEREIIDFRRVAAESEVVRGVLGRIEAEEMIETIGTLIDEAASDQQKGSTAETRLTEALLITEPLIDEVNELLQWEKHREHCDDNVRRGKEIVAENESSLSPEWRKRWLELCGHYDDAARAHDFRRLEEIAFGDMPEHFKRNDVLSQRVGGGPAAREGAGQVGSSRHLRGTLG